MGMPWYGYPGAGYPYPGFGYPGIGFPGMGFPGGGFPGGGFPGGGFPGGGPGREDDYSFEDDERIRPFFGFGRPPFFIRPFFPFLFGFPFLWW
jgi:hypothetical protein